MNSVLNDFAKKVSTFMVGLSDLSVEDQKWT
jgi:hypothetical protein